MLPTRTTNNPFALMMDPEAVLQAMAGSDRLARLQRRVCKPLDKPLIPRAGKDVADYDQAIDDADLAE